MGLFLLDIGFICSVSGIGFCFWETRSHLCHQLNLSLVMNKKRPRMGIERTPEKQHAAVF